jgi:molybdate transport system ATP-binding protein
VLHCIAGLERPAGGVLEVNSARWQDQGVFLPAHRRPIGYVFQEASLFAHLSVRSNLEYGLKRIPRSQRQVAFSDAVELLGIAPLLARKPGHLSGGERQRVAIARALLTSPQLLLMDEPLSALDQTSKAEILPYLQRLHGELSIPVLYVSHSLDEVAKLADYLILLERGQVRAAGPLSDLAARLDLPLAHGEEAGAVLDATVTGFDEPYHLAYLQFPGGRIAVARQHLTLGSHVRIRIHARDVSLTLVHQQHTSILNIIPARVVEFVEDGPAQAMVRLDASGTPLLARVTRKSAHLLGLYPGMQVYAQVKSAALVG